jgi:outer membrane protein TolC
MKVACSLEVLVTVLSLPAAAWPEQPPTLPPPRWLGADAPQAAPAPPTSLEDEGPADGLTLDAALDRLLVGNAALRARSLEVSEAQADELTASLRNPPAIFLSGNSWPYGRYSEQRPGAAEYEIAPAQNVDYSGKRRSHMRQAAAATRQVEARYQNAVREEIDRLHEAFVAVLEARETVRLARANLQWLTELEETTRRLVRQGSERSRRPSVPPYSGSRPGPIWKKRRGKNSRRSGVWAPCWASPPTRAKASPSAARFLIDLGRLPMQMICFASPWNRGPT